MVITSGETSMAPPKKNRALKESPTQAPNTFRVILCYQIHSAPREPAPSASPSEEIWRRHNRASGLHQISAKPWAYARKEVLLPFVPFPGLRLDVAHVDGGVPIIIVRWRVDGSKNRSASDLSAGYFLCTYEDQYPEEGITYDKLKKYATESGWEVREFGLP
jgi:hypothetical protein